MQRFRVKCGLLGSEAGKGRPLDLGRMSANGSKTVYYSAAPLYYSLMLLMSCSGEQILMALSILVVSSIIFYTW